VSALFTDVARDVFASEFLLTSPKSEEVTIEEVVCR